MSNQRIIKMGRTKSQIEEIELKSMRNIRCRAAQIDAIMNQLAMFSSSMSSPNDSPIKINNKSSSGQNISQIQQFINRKLPSYQQIKQQLPQFKKTLPDKKKPISSVHFTNYMKPIGKLSDKCKNILEQQRKAKEQALEKEQALLKQSKQKSTRLYKNVNPRYNTTNDRSFIKDDAIAQSRLHKQQKQLAEATFSPNINKNYRVDEPFEIRLQNSKIKKLQKEGAILKTAMKEQTYQPKINSKNMTESKVKKIWSSTSRNMSQVIANNNRLSQYIEYESQLQDERRSRVKVRNASDFDFIIQQT